MHASVPQFIDVEDKIAGPLTWKQLFWMIGLFVSLIILYLVFKPSYFLIIGIPTALIFIAFAFVKPYGQSFSSFTYHGIMHLFGPKIYVWQRETQSTKNSALSKYENTQNKQGGKTVTVLTLEEITELAKTLDKK